MKGAYLAVSRRVPFLIGLAGPLELGGAAGETLDSLGNRGVGGEQVAHVHSQQWLDDEQVRRRRGRGHRNALRIGVELSQGAGQRVGIAG